ncbi:MAG: hypothetical protein IID40_00745 [Planctomycetes bacterium]|nr:hypothetical protein [Planctomycetota bacterium]
MDPSRDPIELAVAGPPSDRVRRSRRSALLVVALLAGVTLLFHGWSLADGSVMDDHWHQKGLREHGWSPSELMRTLTVEPAAFTELWWQDKSVRWEYGRPLFILVMKIVYSLLGGDDPIALHAFSILLHFLNACLVWRLCLALTGRRFWSAFGAVLFVVYPHSIVSVSWPSAQNAVLATTLMLAALSLYARCSGLNLAIDGPPSGAHAPLAPSRSASRSGLLLGAVFVLWIMALFTRENALMLPGILLAMDVAFGGREQVWRQRRTYLAFALIGIGFVVWRLAAVTHPMPDVYVRRPDGDWIEYGFWCLAKLLHYLCTSIWPAAMAVGPTGRFNPWIEVPWDCAFMLAVVGVLGGGYALLNHRQRGWWIWPAWILLAVLPVVPVIATPHSGYLCGVGYAVAVVLGPASRVRDRGGMGRLARSVAVLSLATMGLFAFLHRLQWSGAGASERYTLDWIASDPPPAEVGDVFFINLPFANVYVKPALERRLGDAFKDVRCHVLTYSPQPFMMQSDCRLEQLDAHRFSIEVVGQPYFSRLLGRFFIEGFRSSGRLRTGDHVVGSHFEVDIARAGDEGVEKLVFSFPRPLTDPTYHFYLTSRVCGAVSLRFGPARRPPSAPATTTDPPTESAIERAIERLAAGRADAAEVLFAGIAANEAFGGMDAVSLVRAATTMRDVATTLAVATADPIQDHLTQPELSIDDWKAVRGWWHRRVDDDLLRDVWLRRRDFAHYQDQLEEIDNGRRWVSLVLKTDLYLTGPPFPGPR